jgi:hypothetical protein
MPPSVDAGFPQRWAGALTVSAFASVRFAVRIPNGRPAAVSCN